MKLYKKYLYDHITSDEFKEMRYTINNMNDNELSQILEQEWNDNVFQDKLKKESKENIREKLDFFMENNREFYWKKTIKFTAIILPLLIIISLFTYKYFSLEKQNNFIVSVDRGNKATVTLPDQSKVWMNSNSTLEYKKGERNIREVKLSGEALFRVYKNRKQPFIVTINNLNIEVLGTSFNIKAKPDKDIIEISLIEGSLKMQSEDLSQDYYLKPNEKAIFSKSKKQLQIFATDTELETAWRNNKLSFRSEKFIDVMSMLEDWYDVKIISKCPEIENDLISGSFKEEKLETILKSLIIQYNINYIISGDTIIIESNRLKQ